MIVSARSVFARVIESVVYWILRFLVGLLQSLSLRDVARVGRLFGGLAYWVDGRHRGRAIANLSHVYGDEWGRKKIIALAKENSRRLGESYCCAIKVASMSHEQLKPHVELKGVERFQEIIEGGAVKNHVVAIGHFGNFELYARMGQFIGFSQLATTYRALKNSAANRVMGELRQCSGTRYFERRFEVGALKEALRRGGMVLGLLSDHHAGGGGVVTEFLGRPCSSTAAPAVLALRYQADLRTAICYRTDLGQWAVEIGEAIPLRQAGEVRSVDDIIQDVQHAMTDAVRRDPANWFWVHNRWRTSGRGFQQWRTQVEKGRVSATESNQKSVVE
ncbi:MAG: Lipid A biosynthesis lauroyltransferase [Verrucomicrobia subdivision 3 bacterium]|nr:Lipid A biosynthesis lauroyltransferase [Limisphaerales bacterium]MCS1417063.1 Lipid A biosynthesis lauroyltransferase [Limisphaerales bacterium]